MMPKFDVKTSDGRVVRVNAPSGATEADAINYVNALLNPPEPQSNELPTIPEYAGFFSSLFDSATTLPRYGLEALAYQADPNNPEKRKALLEAGAEDANTVTPGFGEGNNWNAFKAMAGSSLGQWVAPAIAATGTAMTGVGAPAAPYVGGATRLAQYDAQYALRAAQEQQAAIDAGQKPQEFDWMKTLAAAGGSALLDEFELDQFSKIFRALPFARNMMRPGSEAPSLLVQAARAGSGSFTGNVFKGVVKGIAFEVPQEMAQSALERWQAGLSLNDESAAEEYKQSAIGAFLLGGAAGAIQGALPNRQVTPGTSGTPGTAGTTTTPPPPGGSADTTPNNNNPPPPPPGAAGPATPGTPTGTNTTPTGTPPNTGGLPNSVQAGLNLGNRLNADEQERQRQENARNNPPAIPTTPEGKPVTEWDALTYLANVAEQEGVDLTKLTRPEYVEYAIKHGVILGDQQLREAPQYRVAKSLKELMELFQKSFADARSYEKQSIEFARAMDNMPTKYGPKTVPGFHDDVRASVHNKNRSPRFHFYINGASKADTGSITHKGYLGFTNAPASLTAQRFQGYLNALADAGYKGQVNSIKDTIGQSSISDQVVFHGATEQDVQLAHQIAKQYFGNEINFTDTGRDVKGKSYSQWLAGENRRRVLALSQLRQQQAQLRQQQAQQGANNGQSGSGSQQNQGLPSGQPNAQGSGTSDEVSARGGAAQGERQEAQQSQNEGLDDNQRDTGEPPAGTRFSRITLTPEERAADEKAVSDAFDAAGGNITRAELRRATGIDNDARLDAARNRLKNKGKPIKLTIPRMTPEERQQLRQERIEEEQRRKSEEGLHNAASDRSAFNQQPETAAPEPKKPKSGGMFAQDVQNIVDRIVKGWKNLPKIHVVQSISDLPGNLKNVYPDTKGFIIDDEIFIIADNARSLAGVRATLFHEALGHFGLRARFGKQLNALLLDMYTKHTGLRKAVDKWLAENGETYSKLPREERIAAAMEELFAEHAETEHKNIWIAQAIQRVIALVRSFMRDMGLVRNYNYSDIMDIVRQSHEAVIEGKGVAEGKVSDNVRFQRATNVLPISYFGKKIGGKPGGSNPGGLYENSNGEKWLLKGNNAYNFGQVNKSESDDRAKNEVLASKLYRLTGLDMPEMQLVNLDGEYGSAPNGLGVAGSWVDGLKDFNPNNLEHKIAARAYFAVSAWLGNYDVIGMGYDNLKVDSSGNVWHIDPGGALLFRAQGLPKDQKYGVGSDGMLNPDAPEWESMRNTNDEQKKIFGTADPYELNASAHFLNNISPDQIKDVVSLYAQGNADFKKRFADNLIARREAILQKAGVEDNYAKTKNTTKASNVHPSTDDKGKAVIINSPSTTLLDDLHDSDGWATWAAQDATDPNINDYKLVDLNGTKFSGVHIDDPGAYFANLTGREADKYLNNNLGEPEFQPKAGLKNSAGVIIVEPDGRIWTVHPTNQFGGYNVTFPKGGVEGDTDNTEMQRAAVREAYEETGLTVKITGFLGDYDRSTSRTRYYIAERIGGKPFNMGWESQAVMLSPPSQMAPVLNNSVDKTILNDFIKSVENTTTAPATPAATPAVDPLALDAKEQDYLDRWKKTLHYTNTKDDWIGSTPWETIERKFAKVLAILELPKIAFTTYGQGFAGKRQSKAIVRRAYDLVLSAEDNFINFDSILKELDFELVLAGLSTSKLKTVENFLRSVAPTATTTTPAVDPLALDAKEQDYLDRWKKTSDYNFKKIEWDSQFSTGQNSLPWEFFERKVAKVLAILKLPKVGFSDSANSRVTQIEIDQIVNGLDKIEKRTVTVHDFGVSLSYKHPSQVIQAVEDFLNSVNGVTAAAPTTTAAPAVDPLALDAKEQDYLDRWKKTAQYTAAKDDWRGNTPWETIERKVAKVLAILELPKVAFTGKSTGLRLAKVPVTRAYELVLSAEHGFRGFDSALNELQVFSKAPTTKIKAVENFLRSVAPTATTAAATTVDPLALSPEEQDYLDRWKKTNNYNEEKVKWFTGLNNGSLTTSWKTVERKVAKVMGIIKPSPIGIGSLSRATLLHTDAIVDTVIGAEKDINNLDTLLKKSISFFFNKSKVQAAKDFLISVNGVTADASTTTTAPAAPAVDPLALDAKEQDYLDRWKKTKEYSEKQSQQTNPFEWQAYERKVAKVLAIFEPSKVAYSSTHYAGVRYTESRIDDIIFFVDNGGNDPVSINDLQVTYPQAKVQAATDFLNSVKDIKTYGTAAPAAAATSVSQRYTPKGIPLDKSDPWTRDNTAIVLKHLKVPPDNAWQEAERLIREKVVQRDELNTEAFRKFYSASKIRDAKNQPLLAFRATTFEITEYDGSTAHTHMDVIFASPFAKVAKNFGHGTDGRLYGLWVNLTNPWDHRIPRHVEDLMKHLKSTDYFKHRNESQVRRDIEKGDWTYLESKPILSWIADHHDGMIMTESGTPETLTYAIFGDPKRRTEEGFRPRDQIKSATGNDGNFGLYTGDIRYQRTQQNGSVTQIGTVINTFPVATNNLMEAIRNALSKVPDALRRAYLGFMSLPQIAEMFGKAGQIPSLHNLVKLLEERAASMMDRSRPINANIRKWYLIANQFKTELPRFYDIAMRTTINQIDVLDPAMANNPLTQEFNSLPPELQQVYRELREEYQKYSDELLERIVNNVPSNQVNAIRAQYESKRLKVYLPLFRQGDYWLTYQDKDNATVTRAFDSPRERQMAIDALNDMGEARDIQVYSRLNQIPFKQQPPNGFVGDVIRNMRASGASDEMIDSVYSTLLDYMPADSVRQMFRNNPDRGVLGFEPDLFQAYANVAKRMANQLNNMQFVMPLEEILGNIRAEAGSNRATQAMKDVYANIQSQVDFLRNPMNGSLVNNLSHFSYLWNIAGNISSAIVNISQVPLVVLPILGGKYGFSKASAALKKASSMYFNGGRDDSTDFLQDFTFYKDDLDDEYKQLFNFAVGRSAIRRPTGYEVTEARRTKVEDYTGLRAKVNQALGFVFQNTERFNREVTLIAAYDLAKQNGMTNEEAREEALRVINDAHGSSLAETGPRLFQTGLGKVAFTFKRFAQAQIYLIAKSFYQAVKGEDALTRSTARKQILGIYGAAYAFAGVQGMPLYGAGSLLASMLAAMFGDDDEPFDPDEAVRSAIGDLGYKGPVNQLFNIDIASRTGFNNLIWRDDPRRLAEVGPAVYAMESMLGPAYSTGRNVIEGASSILDGDWERGLESMSPSFIRNGMKGMRYGVEGARNKDGVPIVEDVNGYNTFMQILGFTPADLSEARARAGSMKAAERKIIDRRTALLDRIYAARKEGDIDGLIDAMDAANEFSQKHPERGYAITSDTINRSYKAKQQKELDAVDGVYLDKNLAPYLQNEYGD